MGVFFMVINPLKGGRNLLSEFIDAYVCRAMHKYVFAYNSI